MALSDLDVKTVYSCNGATTTFAIPFDYVDSSEVVVLLTDESTADGLTTVTETTLTNPGGYSIVGANIVTVSTYDGNHRITIKRVNPFTQTYDATGTTAWAPLTAELVYDRLVRMIQELDERLRRVAILRSSSTKTDVTLPDPLAGYFLKWDSNRNLMNGLAVTDFTSRAASVDLSDGNATKSVTFSSTLLDSNYVVHPTIVNTADSSLDYVTCVVTAKSATGFTVKFNSPIVGSNYKLLYQVMVYS